MNLLFLSLSILLATAVASALAGRGKAANAIGAAGAVLGCLAGLVFALCHLIQGGQVSAHLHWSLPLGNVSLGVDGLSAFFLLPTFILGAASAVSGYGFLTFYVDHKPLGAHWFFFNLMIAALALVMCASDGVLFLAAWEAMSLAPFFLISFHHDEYDAVRSAAWTYLVAAHAGFAFLLVLFTLLGGAAGSFAFADFTKATLSPGLTTVLFLLGLVGFGIKAGLAPMHVWLPEAHPAAPSHVSAYLSGALLNGGIYGLIRLQSFLGRPAPWQAYLLLALGLATALLGIVSAMGKRHLKRLLAYSSVENIGLITLALGLALLAKATGHPDLAALSLAGALMHVLAHCLMKGSLFLAAGSVLHGAGTVDMNRLGGLMKAMPVTGAVFALGAAAICGLPPLAGFFSELTIYLAAGFLGLELSGADALIALGGLTGMALTGGLALIVMTKALGMTFLGNPRSQAGEHAHDPSWFETGPMVGLGLCCLLAGLASPFLLDLTVPGISAVLGLEAAPALALVRHILSAASLAGAGLLVLGLALAWVRHRLLSGRPVRSAETWGCGYLAPSARVQYTASSFSQPMTDLLGPLAGGTAKAERPRGYFPAYASYRQASADLVKERGFVPFFQAVDWLAGHLKWLQHGNLNLYILYILATLIALLAWNFLSQ